MCVVSLLGVACTDCWTVWAGSEAYEARKQSLEQQEEYLRTRLPQWITNLEQFFAETNAFAGGGSFFFGANPSCE